MEIPEVIREKAPQMEIKKLEEYVTRVNDLLKAMKPGDVINIAKASKEDTRELFLECIKYYMRSHEWQDGLSFTRGFVSVQKYDISFTKERKTPSPSRTGAETENV
jgi:hypothetical protein